MTERLLHRLAQLVVVDSARNCEFAGLIPEDLACRIIDLVINQRFLQRTQTAPVIIFPTETARIWCDRLESDYWNAAWILFISEKTVDSMNSISPSNICALLAKCR